MPQLVLYFHGQDLGLPFGAVVLFVTALLAIGIRKWRVEGSVISTGLKSLLVLATISLGLFGIFLLLVGLNEWCYILRYCS
jgi:hypothetical protein